MKTTLIAFALMGATAAYASNCGDLANGIYNLTNDLTCSGPGLVVAADNTTINMNGHTIKCVGNGFGGSCQPTIGGGGTMDIGISSKGNNHVTINGKGVVSGFQTGISLMNGQVLTVESLTVTGPAAPKILTNDKSTTIGIYIAGSTCTLSTLSPGPSSQILSNDISNQSVGVEIREAGCVNIIANSIHNNVGRTGSSNGVMLLNSNHVTMYSNIIQKNGANLGEDSGLTMRGMATSQVYLYGNNVSYNCGYGIVAMAGPNNNNLVVNQARANGLGSTEGQCVNPPAGKYFDLAQVSQGVNNNWNPNNLCHTQGPGIPAGVCNLGE